MSPIDKDGYVGGYARRVAGYERRCGIIRGHLSCTQEDRSPLHVVEIECVAPNGDGLLRLWLLKNFPL